MGVLKVRVNGQWENAGFAPPTTPVVGDYLPLVGGAVTGDLSVAGFLNAMGGVYAPRFNITSAASLKTDITPVTASMATAIIGALKPVTYKWQDGGDKINYGFTVEDVEKAAPNIVDASLPIRHYDLVQIVALLVSEVQTLRANVERMAANKGRI